ncbi:MAG TPA: hypothetical protein VMR70_10535 [Flavisolibacter sp.]|nr:hypothetical protein [Flavisolibacter sp.]
MKWVVIFLLSPFACFGQGVKVSLYDNFIKKHRIELEPVVLHAAANGKLAVTFSSVASELFLQLSGTEWGAATINSGDEMIFLFTNDSTLTVRSTGLQSFEPGLNKNTYKHQYALSQDQLKAFSQYEIAAIRKYSFKDFFDLQIQKGFRGRLQKPSDLFVEELKSQIVQNVEKCGCKRFNGACRRFGFFLQQNLSLEVLRVAGKQTDRAGFAGQLWRPAGEHCDYG